MARVALPRIDNCDNCGACCTAQEALPLGFWLSIGNRKKLPAALLEELLAMAARFDLEGWPSSGEACVWYDPATRRCKHYEHRPDICREEVKPGDAACRAWRADLGIDPVRRFRMVNGRPKQI